MKEVIATVPFNDLTRGYRTIRAEIDQALAKVIDTAAFAMGTELELFEKEFAQHCGVKHCLGLSSGTAALELALLALNIKPGDEVITVPNTFVATVEAILNVGAKPVLVDVNDDYLMDPNKVEAAITAKTKAIIPVHLFGRPCQMDRLTEIAQRHNLHLIGDCCQAHDAELQGRNIAQYGTINCFSFYPTKNLGAFGDGGAITTNDDRIAEKVKLLRNHGERIRYYHVIPGHCERLDNLQAAILRVRLKHLSANTAERRALADNYHQLLAETNLILPSAVEQGQSAYHLFIVRHAQRDQLRKFLEQHGIGTNVHYPLPIHLEEGYSFLGLKTGALPKAEQFATEIISLPLYPGLKPEEQEYVAQKIKEFERCNCP